MQKENEAFLLGIFTGFMSAVIIFGLVGLYLK